MIKYEMHEHTQKVFNIVKSVTNKHDPVGLLRMGAPQDEYHPEMPGLVNAVGVAKDWKDLNARVVQVFADWFHESVAAKKTYYYKFSKELFDKYSKFMKREQDAANKDFEKRMRQAKKRKKANDSKRKD